MTRHFTTVTFWTARSWTPTRVEHLDNGNTHETAMIGREFKTACNGREAQSFHRPGHWDANKIAALAIKKGALPGTTVNVRHYSPDYKNNPCARADFTVIA